MDKLKISNFHSHLKYIFGTRTFGMPYVFWTIVRRILIDDLNFIPYKIQILQKQSTLQKEKRLTFAKLMSDKIGNNEIDIGDIDWSDEAHFHLSGQVSKQNMRIWGEEKPNPFDNKPLTQEMSQSGVQLALICCNINETCIIIYYT